MMSTIQEFLTYNKIAVVGVSRKPEKYGYRIFKDLRDKGYEVYPVNPQVDQVDGSPCFKDLSSLPTIPEVVCLVVPPEAGRKVVEECIQMGIKRLWFQPGAESEELISYCESQGLSVVHNQCLMVLSSPKR